MKIIGQGSAALDAELLIFFVGRGRGNGKHSLAHTRYTDHGALSRHMLEQLSALRTLYPECLDIRGLILDIRDHADHRH